MRHRTKIFIIRANEEIQGVLPDFYGHTGVHSIWLRGTNEAIEKLLSVLTCGKMMFPSTFPKHEEVVKQRFPITVQYWVDFMLLKRGSEHRYIRHSARLLSRSNALAFTSLRKESHEKPTTEEMERTLEIIKEQPVYGAFTNSELISVATFHARLPEV